MSKYIIDIPDSVKKIVYFHVGNANAIWTTSNILDDLEELNSDYINEHFGQLQDEAYKRGFEDGKWKSEDGCTGCEYEGKNKINQPCVLCCNAFKNQWTAKKQDDEIKVGDEVRWGMDLIVITRLYMNGGFKWCDGISKDGIAFHVLEENVSKTNRHFDIESILEDMRE